MKALGFTGAGGGPLSILCLGAHSDDIEIGCGGTILTWVAARPVTVHWVVCSGNARRAAEARAGAAAFLAGAAAATIDIWEFRDGFFPYDPGLKERFESLKERVAPDLVFTHYRLDRHQDHRAVSDLTWNTFRDHLVLEYEVPKYDGDLGQPNCFQPLSEETVARKIALLQQVFGSQRDKRWFTDDTFRGLMRLRGVESGTHHAEAFHARKIVIA